jgi:hypothetical protein
MVVAAVVVVTAAAVVAAAVTELSFPASLQSPLPAGFVVSGLTR